MKPTNKTADISPDEDAEITAAALSDIDALPLTDEEWQYVLDGKPVPPRDTTPNFFLDPELLAALKNTGESWEWSANAFLREYAGEHCMFKTLLKRQPDYQEHEENDNLSEIKRELNHEAWRADGNAGVANFHIHVGVRDAFMTNGKGWAMRIREALRAHAIENDLFKRQ